MTALIQLYVELLKWDIEVMSHPAMYIPLLIPIMFFLPFFFAKWAVLTAPFWLPIWLIFAVRDGKQ